MALESALGYTHAVEVFAQLERGNYVSRLQPHNVLELLRTSLVDSNAQLETPSQPLPASLLIDPTALKAIELQAMSDTLQVAVTRYELRVARCSLQVTRPRAQGLGARCSHPAWPRA